ncbi:MAG: hypothetical protein SCK28_12390 [Bacillota bacterium]|nr:hypothetical protein [Bacillota bacterium]
MTALSKMASIENVSELEKDIIDSYIIKESLEIISDEVEYFFDGKLKLVDLFVTGLNFNDIKELQERFSAFIYGDSDICTLVNRISKRVERELSKVKYEGNLQLNNINSDAFNCEHLRASLREESRTLKLSQSISKGIDVAWKKTSPKLFPKALLQLTSKTSVSSLILGSIGVSTQQVGNNMKAKLIKQLRGTIKQHKIELELSLKKEIIRQLISCSSKIDHLEMKQVKTA